MNRDHEFTCCDDCEYLKGKFCELLKADVVMMFPFTTVNSVGIGCPRMKEPFP